MAMAKLRSMRRLQRQASGVYNASVEYQRSLAAYSADYAEIIPPDTTLDEA
jgi:hypothetical protein